MERLKSLSKTDKVGALELMAALKSQLKTSEEEAAKTDAKADTKEGAEAQAGGDPAAEPVTGKLDPGLFSVIPQTFNVSSDS